MSNFHLIAQGIDVVPLQLALHRQPDLFDVYNERRTAPGSPHSQMTDIWVRYNDRRPFEQKGSFEGLNDPHESVWYPAAARLPEIRPIVFGLMARVEGERLGGILITKLPPGGRIDPHIDGGWHAGNYDKFMVAVQTPPGSYFGFHDGQLHSSDGDVWFFRNDVEHWVENPTDRERIVMVVCIQCHRGPAW